MTPNEHLQYYFIDNHRRNQMVCMKCKVTLTTTSSRFLQVFYQHAFICYHLNATQNASSTVRVHLETPKTPAYIDGSSFNKMSPVSSQFPKWPPWIENVYIPGSEVHQPITCLTQREIMSTPLNT